MSEKKNWSVHIRCVVDKDVQLVGCTKEQAYNKPWEYATDELETDMLDWEVLSIEEDK
jgi:hypothetical protein